ncbi:MAG: 6,7-dimethyl-8-ribityllumazine synthase, partial [Pseudomonadota bacterium]
EARFYAHINDLLIAGAEAVLAETGDIAFQRVTVPGALEVPTVIAMAHAAGAFDGFVALGCVIRGETTHYELVAGESCRGLVDLGTQQGIAIGNGILTVENEAQALVRADPSQKDKGGDAARAVLALLEIKRRVLGG